MKRTTSILAATLLLGVGAQTVMAKIGLSSQFVNIVMEGLQPGRSYNLLEIRGLAHDSRLAGE